MTKFYNTVHNINEQLTIQKKSKFWAYSAFVQSSQDANDFIDIIKKKHVSSNHCVFAYIIDDKVQKYSDDKEPRGTAGMPIMSILKELKLNNTIVVVIRYFGGTLLGSSGLMRAYSCACNSTLKDNIVCRILGTKLKIVVDYNFSNKINFLIAKNFVLETIYTDVVQYQVVVEVDKLDDFVLTLKDNTRNCIKIAVTGNCYFAKYQDKYIIY